MELDKETGPLRDLVHGRITVGTEPVLVKEKTKLLKGLLVHADRENTSPIAVGNRDALATNGLLSGFPILPGATLSLPIDSTEIWAVADDVDQYLFFIAV